MAQPIPAKPPTRDPRAELITRLQDAPAEHAAALLSAYEVLQGLHDQGVFDVLRGVLGSRDRLLEVAVGAANAPASTAGIRNMILLINMLGEIDPAVLARFTRAIPRALTRSIEQPEPPGLWALLKDFLWNQDFRHGMAAMNVLIEGIGRGVGTTAEPASGRSK
jgi:uncharacterized protein YjgD (DUF1641 family)